MSLASYIPLLTELKSSLFSNYKHLAPTELIRNFLC